MMMWGLFICFCGTLQNRVRHEEIKRATIGWATMSSWPDGVKWDGVPYS